MILVFCRYVPPLSSTCLLFEGHKQLWTNPLSNRANRWRHQVRLYFSHKSYPFRIGQLVSIWTTFVSDAAAINGSMTSIPNVPLATSIFPGRDTSTHIMVHLKSDTGESIRTPLGCEGTKTLPGLMTLKNFVEGGHEVDECKILVCVKSVG